ncbi:phage N-6-adenine-methyltransferase [Intestinibacillus sp. Marseille-P6563]|uniref:phage N-6-adenine-methyltransferase n=1 Tax=Intestinibacillus sp. Marseille-P6563 TaxID=2364792 RepID=UPI001FA9A5A4|nr:phage N-6-adenine-methyltransferase [Intestinibacillus sp. Marseille-P6563]
MDLSMNSEVMFSSKTDMWETPQDFFDALDQEFHFTLDVCATPENAKCERYYTPDDDGLSQPWNGVVWCNPPYGREIGRWVLAGSIASVAQRTTVVMLLPARTDTRWFHDYILGKAEIRFIRGRLKFGGSKNSAPFPSMVVIFRWNGCA